MMVFSEIPFDYFPEILRIDRTSNSFAWNEEGLREGYQHYRNIGAFKGTELVAFIYYHIIVDEAEIIHLVCDKNFQGNGYARALLEYLQDLLKAQSVKRLVLEVRENNPSAIRLYCRSGFETVGRRKNYYGGKHDAFIQCKDL